MLTQSLRQIVAGLTIALYKLSPMKQVLFTLLCALLIFSCEKEEGLQLEKPFGFQYAGALWKTDLVIVNGVNATKNIKASLYLQLDSTTTRKGKTDGYFLRATYEEIENSQYQFTTTYRAEGLAVFNKDEQAQPWDVPKATLKIFRWDPIPCASIDDSGCTTEVVLGLFPIKSSSEKVIIIETEKNSVTYVYRFIKQ